MLTAARARAGLLLLLFVTLWPAGPLHAQDDAPLSLSAYQERLAAALAQLESGVDLEKVQADLAAIEQVRLPDGRILDIEPLLEGIENVDDARVRLETVLAQLELAESDRTADRLAALERVSPTPRPRPAQPVGAILALARRPVGPLDLPAAVKRGAQVPARARQRGRRSALLPVGGSSSSAACCWRFCSAIGCAAFSVAY